ncbi:MAG: FKBP-type peptidyl-prolyl cis-trans isomerase [Prevotella sp.]|nr:FKBP-type peptidyl-prolyl cis-trans isomerase [Prevotella sp.]
MRKKSKVLTWRILLCATFFTLHSSLFVSCSESDDDNTVEEYPNWQARNEAFFATLEDSLRLGGDKWKKIKSYTKDENVAGDNTEYIYVKVLEEGSNGDSPLYSDTVRVAYRGRLLPSTSYPQGYVFDQTYVGDYNVKTTSVFDGEVSGYKDGFATALLHMHINDRWRIYMPYQLGYGVSGTTGIPGYSVLVFDVALIDFVSGTAALPTWSSRETRAF